MSVATGASFLGLELATPLVVGSCPLSFDPERAKEFADAGAGALVMPSLFEEQIEHQWFDGGSQTPIAPEHFPVSLTFNETLNSYNGGQQNYLRSIERLRGATSLPLVANLNGVGSGKWLSFAKELQAAGSDAIEVTLFRMAMDADEFADDIERDYLSGISHLCREVTIPVTVKLLPYFTSLPNFCGRIGGAGAAGVTLFGRYPRASDDEGSARSRFNWEFSEPGDVSLSLHWLSVIRRCCPKLSFAASGGATTGQDAIRLMQAGADVVMITSPIYRQGGAALTQILQQMCDWAAEKGHKSLREIVGENCHRIQNFPEAYERAAATGQMTSRKRSDGETGM